MPRIQPVIRLGDLRKLEVGDPVMAIGLVRFGADRDDWASSARMAARCRATPCAPFIQTDAAGEPGQLGRPAARQRRRAVVGINAGRSISQSGGFQAGAAIPIDAALKASTQIAATGKATHRAPASRCRTSTRAWPESLGGLSRVSTARWWSSACARTVRWLRPYSKPGDVASPRSSANGSERKGNPSPSDRTVGARRAA